MGTEILVILLYLVTLALIWQFVGYSFFMGVIAFKKKPNNKDKSFLPSVSILVPTYNEVRVIKNRIENLFALDYPNSNYEIIIVDSGSTDGTSEIVESLITEAEINKKDNKPPLKLLKEKERRGKASAINVGKKNSKYDIVMVTDANATFNKQVLAIIMPNFKDPKIGAVGGRYCVENPENSITKSESFYWDLEYIMRLGESRIDSAILFHGEINAWRKDIVHADVSALSEDLDMCIQIRKKGYKIAYEPDAIVTEPSATTVEDQIKQRKRTTIGTIQNIFKHWKYLMLPRDLYSGFIFPSHKTLQILSPFMLSAILILYLLIWNLSTIILHVFLTLIVFSWLLISLAFIKSKLIQDDRENKPGGLVKSLPMIVYYVLINEYLILIAWNDFVFKRYTVLWEKVESSR